MDTVDVMDDVLIAVFTTLAAEFSPDTAHKKAVQRFIWFRSTLPLVCKQWHWLVLGTPALWSNILIDPTAEAQHVKRSGRSDASGCLSEREARGGSGPPTPVRGTSPALGSSPESESGGYWTSLYAPYQPGVPGSSPPGHYFHKHLSRISLNRHQHQRAQLQAQAVTGWLHQNPAAAAGVVRLAVDLTHHSYHDFDRQQLEVLLAALPRVQSIHMLGAVDGTDAYEPLGRIRSLTGLELSSASQACLDSGLMALGYLPSLRHLSVSLDIHPASPWCISDLPTGLASLKFGGMWLQQLPPITEDLTGLTSITLERCQVEQNPLPMLLTLPQLASLTIRNVSKVSSNDSCMLRLLPMDRPQQQLSQLQQLAAATMAAAAQLAVATGSRGSSPPSTASTPAAASASLLQQGVVGRPGLGSLGQGLRGSLLRGVARQTLGSNSMTAAAGTSAVGSASLPLTNTSITSLALVDVGLQQLPSCISQLVALQDLSLALNHDMGLNPSTCLPAELAMLTGLEGLCLGHCSLSQLPAVVAACTGLTRLELQGNALSAAGSGWNPADVGFKDSLRVLDLGGQGSGRGRSRGIPVWVGSCCRLQELRLSCQCLGYSSSSIKVGDVSMSSHMNGTAAPAATAPYSPSTTLKAAATYAVPNSSPVTNGLLPNITSNTGLFGSLGGAQSFSRAPPASQPAGVAAGASVGAATTGGLSLQQLPVLLPQLEVLQVEGGMWEQRAVRDALQLVRQLERSGSRLQVVLPL